MNKFSSAETSMRAIYADKKANSGVKNRIKKMLNIEDEEEKTKEDKGAGADVNAK